MTEGYHIGLATESDAVGITSIYKHFVEQTTVSYEEVAPDAAEMIRRIKAIEKRHVWLVVRKENEVAGYAYASAFRGRQAYNWTCEVSIYMHKDHQRLGLASALYRALHDVLRLQGYQTAYAIMSVPNPASKRFHEAMGYRAFALFENVGFKRGRWNSTQWFQKTLGTYPEEVPPIKAISALDPKAVEAIFAAN